jgi:two-component system, NtrC family, sensor histidine kinase AtoS
MKSFPTQLAANLLKRNQLNGLREVCALLNLDEAPCALLNIESKKIIFANDQLIHFSGFVPGEVLDKPVQILFPGLELTGLTPGTNKTLQIIRKGQPSIQSDGVFQFLDEQQNLLRLRLSIAEQKNAEKAEVNNATIRRLLEISKLTDYASLALALGKGAEIIQEVSGAEAVCIYQADPEFPQFNRIAESGNGSDFPKTLPSLDSMRLSSSLIWTPGMRVLTDLHRFGRMNTYNYIASAPLGEASALVGLVVCAGKNEKPVEFDEELLDTITAQIWNVQQHYLLIENLQKENRSYARLVNLLNAAFSNINEGIILLSPDLTIQHINPAAEWILGYNSTEVQGQEYGNVLIGTDRISPALEEARKGMTTHNIGKVNLNRRNGQAFPALVQVLPVMMKESLVGIEVILNDISENENNKSLTQHLEHRALIGDFTAAFAHDIRNPINNIVTGLQLLAVKIPVDDPNQEVVNRVQGDCTRLNHLMESFLAFSRLNDMHFEAVDIGAFLTKTMDRWHPRFMRENITPIIQIDEKLDKMNGDPRALDRVFTNLISNAVDAMATSGDTLAVKATMNYKAAGLPLVEVSISDNGPGIPDDIKDRIFEPFVSTNSQKGTGLGLAITKQIVTALKGSISVTTFPGGTVFTVSIPACNGEC